MKMLEKALKVESRRGRGSRRLSLERVNMAALYANDEITQRQYKIGANLTNPASLKHEFCKAIRQGIDDGIFPKLPVQN